MEIELGSSNALLIEAKRLGKHPSKRAAIDAALDNYIRFLKRRGIRELFGTIDYYDDAPGIVKANKSKKKKKKKK